MTTIRASQPLFIVFLDLTHFAAETKRVGDLAAADAIDGYYELVSRSISAAGGRTVKFIGDAALAVFQFGAVGDKRFDIIGQAVNDTARMRSNGIPLSDAALAKLSPSARARFNGVR